MDLGRVAFVGFFAAGGDAPELVTIAEEAFDEMTPFGETIWRDHLEMSKSPEIWRARPAFGGMIAQHGRNPRTPLSRR